MKIVSWNVNGIRAIERKGAFDDLMALGADVICLQETKAEKEQLSKKLQNPDGYHGYFHSSRERKGYAGSAIYSKKEPLKVVHGLPDDVLDRHGRTIAIHLKDLIVVNCYFPNGKSKTAPLEYKMKFYDEFLAYAEELNKEKPVVLTGDFNVAHEAIDLARPKENENNIGFLPQERAWVDELIASGFTDVFRDHNPRKQVYSYWDMKSRARDRNVGWRIDYFFVSPELTSQVQNIEILTNMMGSDHAPVVLEVE
jgi:exodeoxyribonuclease-3